MKKIVLNQNTNLQILDNENLKKVKGGWINGFKCLVYSWKPCVPPAAPIPPTSPCTNCNHRIYIEHPAE